jgi:hypothetical protein
VASWALWLLGYPEATLTDADDALKNARETGQAATVMFALCFAGLTHIVCGDYARAHALLDETIALADDKGVLFWKAAAMMNQGWLLALTGKAAGAVQRIPLGIDAWRMAHGPRDLVQGAVPAVKVDHPNLTLRRRVPLEPTAGRPRRPSRIGSENRFGPNRPTPRGGARPGAPNITFACILEPMSPTPYNLTVQPWPNQARPGPSPAGQGLGLQ